MVNPMIKNQQIIPFGKYSGQPVEAMASDQKYCDWLMQQTWFTEKYPQLSTIIINNFSEPSETPEHNKMQAYFFDNKNKRSILKLLGIRAFNLEKHDLIEFDIPDDKEFIDSIVLHVEAEIKGFDLRIYTERQDNLFFGFNTREELISSYWIELKPTLGDDYPAVLRQIKQAMKLAGTYDATLIIGSYTGIGASFELLKTIFTASHINVILIDGEL
jgi:hypothetical protein